MKVKTIDLFLALADALQNECDTLELDFFPEDDEESAWIAIEAVVDEFETIGLDPIYDADSPDREEPLTTPVSPAPIFFTNSEIELLTSSLKDSIDYCLAKLKQSSLTADERSAISQKLKAYESLQREIF